MASDGNERLCTEALGRSDAVDGEVARVRRYPRGYGVAVLDDAPKHRLEVLRIRTWVAQRRGDDDLVWALVDGDLRVVCLNKRPIAQHDPTLGVREIALRLGLGQPVWVLGWRVAR